MQIIEDIANMGDLLRGCCLTVGNFDGVHLGHKAIVEACRKISTKTAVMTFDPHPVAILHPERTLQVLTPLPLKAALLEQTGADYLIVIKDNYKLLTLPPEKFVCDFLAKVISPAAVAEGDDFHFGYGRSGDCRLLAELGKKSGFAVKIVPPENVSINGVSVKVSSTAIRHFLQEGKIDSAAAMLGRPYRLMGRIVKGRGKGRELGFPTANIAPQQQIVPAEGVYAGYVSIADDFQKLCIENQKIPAVFSLGRAKTFISDHPLLLEAHLLGGCREDIYDKYLAMDFAGFVRGQRRFENEKALIEQISADCRTAEKILSGSVNFQ